MFQRKKGLFEEVYGHSLELVCRAEGRDEFEPLAAGAAGLA